MGSGCLAVIYSSVSYEFVTVSGSCEGVSGQCFPSELDFK
jgi:hypothetical protein